MNKALHLRDDIDRLYVSRKEGGRELASIEKCVNASIQGLDNYTKKQRKLIIAASNSISNIRTKRKTTKTKMGRKTSRYISSFVWFYGISTIVGYLMTNPIYTYILNI